MGSAEIEKRRGNTNKQIFIKILTEKFTISSIKIVFL